MFLLAFITGSAGEARAFNGRISCPASRACQGDMNEDLQLDVQRLLGRCMLRMQHYERLMKAILAESEMAGPVDTLAAQRVARVENVSDKSLGTLVESLFQSCVVPEGFERELLSNDNTPTDKVSMAFSVRLSLQRESWITAKAAVKELVGLRNRMVHHLVDDFDLSSDSGCIDASRYLKEGFDLAPAFPDTAYTQCSAG